MTGLTFTDHRSRIWRVICLHSDGMLSLEDRDHLFGRVIERYYNIQENGNRDQKKGKIRFKGNNYEATIKCDGRYYVIGGNGGRYFYGRLETEKGIAGLTFLVTEPVDASLN
jgi:hypothetical protein